MFTTNDKIIVVPILPILLIRSDNVCKIRTNSKLQLTSMTVNKCHIIIINPLNYSGLNRQMYNIINGLPEISLNSDRCQVMLHNMKLNT